MRFIRFRFFCSVLVVVACSAFFRSVAGQESTPPANPASGLPTSIRLVNRGRVGDVFRFQTLQNIKRSLSVAVTQPHGYVEYHNSMTRSGTRRFIQVQRVRSISPQGNLAIEASILPSQWLDATKDKRVVKNESGKHELIVYAPNGTMLSRTALATKSVRHGTKQKEPLRLFRGIVFPDRNLTVGDTWTGKMNVGMTETHDLYDYQAKLVGIEMHRGLPCARIDCSLDYGSVGNEIQKTVLKEGLKKAPKNAELTGEPDTTGSYILFVSLDRGVIVEERMEVSVNVDATITSYAQDYSRSVSIEIQGPLRASETSSAVQYPKYDSSLVPAVKTSKPAASP